MQYFVHAIGITQQRQRTQRSCNAPDPATLLLALLGIRTGRSSSSSSSIAALQHCSLAQTYSPTHEQHRTTGKNLFGQIPPHKFHTFQNRFGFVALSGSRSARARVPVVSTLLFRRSTPPTIFVEAHRWRASRASSLPMMRFRTEAMACASLAGRSVFIL